MTCIPVLLQAATVTGVITDRDWQDPLMGANVFLAGTEMGSSTDPEGRYRIEQIPAGDYTLTVRMIGYATEERRIRLTEDETLELSFAIGETALEMDEVIVKGEAETGSEQRELDLRFRSDRISDALAGDMMRRVPDSDVASAVRRATGVSTMGGDPIIRGLGIRYSRISLNQAMVSGTEPNRSAVALDLFPSSMMSQVTISKSYSPDQFGEFGGGVVNMDTWGALGANELSVSTDASIHSETTGREFLNYRGGGLDFLGFDDGARALPSAIRNASSKITLRGRFSDIGFPVDELERLSESFSNNWNTRSTTARPGQNLNWSLSRGSKLWNRKLDWALSSRYSNSSEYRETERNIFKGGTGGRIERQHEYDFHSYQQSTGLGGVASFRYELSPTSRLNLQSMYNHTLNDETRLFDGWNDDRGKFIRDTRFRFVSETTLNSQLAGSHLLPDLMTSILDWRISYSLGTRYEPDTREIQYEADPDDEQFVLADETQSGSRIFNDLADHTVSVNLDWKFHPSDVEDGSIKTGLALVDRRRDSETRFFQFEPQSFHSVDLSQDPQSIFHPDNIGENGFLVREATRPTDSYDARQTLGAAYAMAEKPLTHRLRVIGGVRLEQSHQEVTSYELFAATSNPVTGKLDNTDLLPALNLVYALAERQNLRFAASQTVSRPDFRELSEFEFTDIIGGHAVVGNPDLQRALIRNFDLRWERMSGLTNLLAVSVFYKHFSNPVEVTIQPTAQNRVSYENAKAADNYGVEFELRQNLGDLAESLYPISALANLTLVQSDITLSDSTKGIQTSSTRPLHGQSPYLLNLGLSYQHPGLGTTADAFLHVFGKRIAEVGTKPLPDVYEMPHPELDVSLRHPLTHHFSLRGSVQNVLNPEVRFEQGGDFTERYREGRTFALGLTYRR